MVKCKGFIARLICCAVVGASVFLPLNFQEVFAQVADKVSVQTQINEKYARVVFRLNDIEKFEVSFANDTVQLDFGRPINVTAKSKLLVDLSEHIAAADFPSDKPSVVVLKLKDKNAEIKKFKSRDFAGIDIVFPPKGRVSAQAEAAKEPAQKRDETATTKSIFGKNIPVPKERPKDFAKNIKIPVAAVAQDVYGPPLPGNIALVEDIIGPLPVGAQKKKDKPYEISTEFIGPPTKAEILRRIEEAFNYPPAPPEPGKDWEGEKAVTWDDSAEMEVLKQKEKIYAPQVEEEQEEPEPAPVVIVREEADKKLAEDSGPDEGGEFTAKAMIDNIENGVRITFPWNKRTAAAVYDRGGYLWSVFNKQEILNLTALEKNNYIKSAEQIFHKDFSIVKIRLDEEKARFISKKVLKNELNWVVEIKKGEQKHEEESLNVGIDNSSIIPKVNIPISDAAEPLKLLDPIIGDRIVVVPVYRSNIAVDATREFVDFSLIETFQGIAVPVKSDNTLVQATSDRVNITKLSGLNLFSGVVQKSKGSELAEMKQKLKQVRSVFPFDSKNYDKPVANIVEMRAEKKEEEKTEKETKETKKEESPEAAEKQEDEGGDDEEEKSAESDEEEEKEDIYEIAHGLLLEVIEAENDKKRMESRKKLAKFYFSNAFYAESLGVLQEAVLSSPEEVDSEARRLLAMSHYMMGHHIEAAQLFEEIASGMTMEQGLDEINMLWWASNYQIRPKSMQSTKEIPLAYFENYDGFLRDYPHKLRRNLGLLAAEYRIENDRLDLAKGILDLVGEEADKQDTQTLNSLRYLEAKILEKEKRFEAAIEIWKELSEDVMDRFNRARATFAMYKLQYTMDKVGKEETIQHLDRLRIVWKGDDFELELLKFLGGLYIFERDFVNGLRTWRELVTEFPKTQEALLVARQMKKTFIDLFDKGVAYELDPFEALTIYFEFRELTPVGEVGDNIIRQLVDHFVEADLLENAAALLTHQVRFRAKGDERARLAVKLAEINLTNKRPDLTLQALDFVKDAAVPADVAEQYKYLRARALIQLGKNYETLRMLADDWSKQAQTLRLQIFLYQQNWFGIMNITEPRLAEVIERGNPIKDESLKDLLMLAIAYATQREHEKLLKLQTEFIDKIEDQNGRNIFAFVTKDSGAISHLKFDDTVQLADIAGFVTNYLFWPSREWKSVIDILEPQLAIKKPDKKGLTQDEANQIIQLAISYAMEMRTSKDKESAKNAEKGLKRLQRDFASIQIDERSLPLFLSLTQDPDLVPKEALSTPTPLKSIETFIDSYNDMIVGKGSLL